VKITEIKTAINNRIIANGGRVYSNETDEGYDKPAFFVEVIPITRTRISPVYEEIELKVEIHYEPSVETEEKCLQTAESIDAWFATPIPLGDRMIKPPEEIQHMTDDDITLYSEFSISVTRIYNEEAYTGEDTPMGEAELELNIIKQGGR